MPYLRENSSRLHQSVINRQLTDFDDLAAFFPKWSGRFEQLTPGRFAGQLKLIQGPRVRIVALNYDQMILARGQGSPGYFSLYPVNASNAAGIWQGRQLEPGNLVVHGLNSETNHRGARNAFDLGLSVPADFMASAARTLTATDCTHWPTSWAAIAPAPHLSAIIEQCLQTMLARVLADAMILDSPEGEQLEMECLRAVVAGVGGDHAGQSPPSLPVRAKLVRRADDLMRARLKQTINILELCAILGTSDRSLRLAFKERFGVGPMTYYRMLRLNAVRSELKSHSVHLVSETARRYGFHHLSNFAADYRHLFGERPSATRRTSR